MRRRGWCGCWRNLLGEEGSPLARFSKDLFVDATECGRLAQFWLKRGWIRDVSNLAYSKREGVGNFFGEQGSCGFRGMYWCVDDIGGMSGVVDWPSANTNSLLVSCRDLKFGVGNKGIKGVVPLDKKPRVVNKLKG
jgi:hypothetical protein